MENNKQPLTAQTEFKISQNWGCVKSLEELLADAKFMFNRKGGVRQRRPMIVLNTPIVDNLDCIEIDYDRYGLKTNGITNFNDTWGECILDSTKNYNKFIREYLVADGAPDLLTDYKGTQN